MADLVVVVPTRGRPSNAGTLVDAFNATCTASVELCFAVDEDDPTLDDYLPLAGQQDGCPTYVTICHCGPWQPMVSKLNAVAASIAARRPRAPAAIGFFGDDHLPRTVGWDSSMLAMLDKMHGGIVYGDDLLQGRGLCTAWLMSTSIVATLGRMVPAPVEHMYSDNSVMLLGDEIGRIAYMPHVIIEHRHAIAGKAAWDDGYRAVNSPAQYARDKASFEEWRRSGFAGDVRSVQAALGADDG